jgi:hypothetical protein
MVANLADVTTGSTNNLGTFSAPATGGWGNNRLVPLRASTNEVTALAVNLNGATTLRFSTGNGDFDFILFSPAPAERPNITGIVRNADGTITVTWTGGGTLQSATSLTGPFEDVPGSTSPFTFTPPGPVLFGRVRQ